MKTIRKSICVLLALTCCWGLGGPAFASAIDTPWQSYEKAASVYGQNGSSQELVELLQSLRERAEDPVLYARASFLLSQVLQEQADISKAHKVLNDLLSDGRHIPETVKEEARLRDGRLFLKEGKREEALRLFVSVAENASGIFVRREGRLALAWQFAEAGQWQRVDSLLQMVAQDKATEQLDERIKVLRARKAVAQGVPEDAIELLRHSDSRAALKCLAEAYERANKAIMAVAVYKKLHDRFPGSPEAEEALFHSGEVFMRAEDWLAARAQFHRLLETFPESSYSLAVQFRLGWIYLQLDQIEEALAAFRAGATGEHSDFFSYMEAECLRRQGNDNQPEKYQEAIRTYNRIVALDPNSPLAPLSKLRSAMIMMQKGDSEDGVVTLRQFLTLYPKDPLAPAATFLLATKGSGEARQKYLNNILQSNDGGGIFSAGLVALQKGDYDKGRYQEVINRRAQFPPVDSLKARDVWHGVYHLLLAESYYYLKQYDLARKEYALVMDGADEDLGQKAAFGDAWCLMQMGHPDSAALAFDGLLYQLGGENYIRASFGLATARFRMKQFEKAMQTYPIEIQDSNRPDLIAIQVKSQYQVGECYFRLEYYRQAIETWEKLAGDFPESELAPKALFRAGDTYFQANYFKEALEAFQSIRDRYPQHPLAAQSTLKMAQSHFNAQEYDAAVAEFESFIGQYPQDEAAKDALEGIQLCYYRLGQTDQASEAFQKLIDQAPNAMLSADARFQLAKSHMQSENYDKAIEAFKEIVTLYPGSSYAQDAQFALAQAYFAKGEFAQSNGEFSRYIEYFPGSSQSSEAIFDLGVGYFNLQSYLSASDYFVQIIDKFPDSEFYGPALQNIAWCYDRLEEKQQASKFFTRYLTEFAGSEDAQKIELQVARLAGETGQPDQAIASFERLQSSADKDIAAEASYRLGMAYLEQRKRQPALKAFDFAVKNGVRDNYYRLSSISQLAAMYEEKQEWERAVEAYKLLADSAPEENLVKAAEERINVLTQLLTQ